MPKKKTENATVTEPQTGESAVAFGVRISAELAETLDELAKEAKLSRNALVERALREAYSSMCDIHWEIEDTAREAYEKFASEFRTLQGLRQAAEETVCEINARIAAVDVEIGKLLDATEQARRDHDAGAIIKLRQRLSQLTEERDELINMRGEEHQRIATLDREIENVLTKISAEAASQLREKTWPKVWELLEAGATDLALVLNTSARFFDRAWMSDEAKDRRDARRLLLQTLLELAAQRVDPEMAAAIRGHFAAAPPNSKEDLHDRLVRVFREGKAVWPEVKDLTLVSEANEI